METELKSQGLEKWVSTLSPETLKSLKAILFALIPVAEMRASNPFDFSFTPIDRLDFGAHKVSKTSTTEILDALSYKIGSEEMYTENEGVFMTLAAIGQLKYLQSFVDESPVGKEKTPENNPFLFYLSRKEGLFRIFNGQKEIYPVHRAKYRMKILDNLTKQFQETKDLADSVGTEPQQLRAQIAGIKKYLEKHFVGVDGEDFIKGEQTLGYRLGEKITLKKRY